MSLSQLHGSVVDHNNLMFSPSSPNFKPLDIIKELADESAVMLRRDGVGLHGRNGSSMQFRGSTGSILHLKEIVPCGDCSSDMSLILAMQRQFDNVDLKPIRDHRAMDSFAVVDDIVPELIHRVILEDQKKDIKATKRAVKMAIQTPWKAAFSC